MLNISKKSINKKIDLSDYKSGKLVADKKYYKQFNKLSLIFLLLLFITLFLPWTQNISGQGNVTTLKPNQRPQNIQSQISGRIEEWFIQEGNYVKKGDTILRLSEIKSEYFDAKLVERTGDQIQSKSQSIQAYSDKVNALQNQILALQQEQMLKLQQAELKVKSNERDLEAAATNQSIAKTQYDRSIALQSEGLKATKDVEEKRMKLQSSQAKYVSQQNKLTEAQIDLSRIKATFADKIAKAQSNLYTAQSSQFNTEVEVSKLENNYSNYAKRNMLQFVTAPQNGYINKALKGGVGETFKQGESLVTIMPADYDLAVETFVRPIDLPLIHIDEKVRVQFDGWPAIVFSGWESVSYGTYGAKVVAIENFISNNGMYRVLLAPDSDDHKWPDGIRVGSGAKTIALLDDVPIWYELWRQLNGFPPNFYKPKTTQTVLK
ncbi:MAG: biotin attachment protein [Bacteroidetes bacterium MedPE-SWsnd-G2]|nr:MAG: biotin attachment protein [Bacteroidetes bacterium MedPE-SWsnd-G2]